MSKWYGKIIFDNEGIESYEEFETEEAAKAYSDGFKIAKEMAEQGRDDNETNPLEDYWSTYDQVEPVDE